MNWFEQFKHDFGIESNYQISKKTGITASSLTRLNTSKDWESVKIGTMIKLATITGKTLDDFVNYLEESKSND